VDQVFLSQSLVNAVAKPKRPAANSELQGAAPQGREAELVKKIAELEEGLKLTAEFLGALAHELRNPLAPIRNSLHILKLTCGSDNLLQESVGMIDRQLHALIRLIDRVHDLSRFARGNLRLQKETVDLNALIQSAVKLVQHDLERAGQKLTLQLARQEVLLEGDSTRLQQLVVQLLQNAIKFSDPGGEVTIEVQTDGPRVTIHVRDTGIGIDAEMLDKIFDLYRRGNDPRSHGRSGLGIGLSLARAIVKLHGGAIEAKSRGAGQGSEFLVSLPIHS
jgi:signal transduction histidine kinase